MFDDAWERELLRDVAPPDIPDTAFPVTDFGARPNTDELQTAAIQAAIDAAAARGGGRVLLPSGRFVCGSLRLQSRVELCLSQPDTVLAFAPVPTEEMYPLALCHWETMPCYNFRAPLYALDAHDIRLSGPGVIDGQASPDVWWNWHHQMENAWSRQLPDPQSTDRALLRELERQGVPAKERRFGDGHRLRPCLVQLLHCQRVLLENVTLQNSPMWTVSPVACESLICRGLTLRSAGPNSDGIDPESCTGVLIEACRFETGDDCISLKAGRNPHRVPAPPPCRRVVIRHNRFLGGHGGVALGSETSGGICDVSVHHNRFESDQLVYALRLKSNAARGGRLENLWFHDCDIAQVLGAAIHGTLLYEDGFGGACPPTLRNLCFQRIRAHGGRFGVCLEGLKDAPIRGLTLSALRLDGVERPLLAAHWDQPSLSDVFINGLAYPRPIAVRLTEAPTAGQAVRAEVLAPGDADGHRLMWALHGVPFAEGSDPTLPADAAGRQLSVAVWRGEEQALQSRSYVVLPPAAPGEGLAPACRMLCSLGASAQTWAAPDEAIARGELATLLCALLSLPQHNPGEALVACAARRLMTAEAAAATVSRQELATILMQAYGPQYRNASTARPTCRDAQRVLPAYATNVARTLYFGFQQLDAGGAFHPEASVSRREAADALWRVAHLAWLA